jgi:hypothetical protein
MPVGTGVRQCPSSKFWDLMALFENILSTGFKVGREAEVLLEASNCSAVPHCRPLRKPQRKSGFLKVFRCGARRDFCGHWWWPALTNLGRRKLRGLVSNYGERAQVVGAMAANSVALWV